MRLIDTETLQLIEVGDPEGFEYVILSHTWGAPDSEVLFRDMADLEQAKKKPAVAKIENTCKLARDRNTKWAWVDTCCIDKSSSAELTEAINSMYRWYQLSVMCIVYLSDLPASTEPGEMDRMLPRCMWFTRGWTLQELLAPESIVFYDRNWNMRGTETSLRRQLSDIMGIQDEYLEYKELIRSVSIAERMSWAAQRKTTRIEDMAYCLFGVFDVNLPLIYGEGGKAFIRLQEAIASDTADLSLLAWCAKDDGQLFRGVFALAPAEFDNNRIKRVESPALQRAEFRMANSGFHINTRLSIDMDANSFRLDLQCYNSRPSNGMIGIYLTKTSRGYIRSRPWTHAIVPHHAYIPTEEVSVFIPKLLTADSSQWFSSISAHQLSFQITNTSGQVCRTRMRPAHLWDGPTRSFITDRTQIFRGIVEVSTDVYVNRPYAESRIETYEHVIVLGLASHLFQATGRDQDLPGEPYTAWAAIYEHKGEAGVSRMLVREYEFGFTKTLAEISEYLSTTVGSARELPICSIIPLPTEPYPAEEKGPYLQLSVSSTTDQHRRPHIYQAVLTIERKLDESR